MAKTKRDMQGHVSYVVLSLPARYLRTARHLVRRVSLPKCSRPWGSLKAEF